jgi:hypothetical protein
MQLGSKEARGALGWASDQIQALHFIHSWMELLLLPHQDFGKHAMGSELVQDASIDMLTIH